MYTSSFSPSVYSWSKFGREAEFVVTLYLKLRGWTILLSKGSRGPADIIAIRNFKKWLIQVKSSTRIPRLKGYEVESLNKMAQRDGGEPVIATLQPIETVIKSSMTEKQNMLGLNLNETAVVKFGNYAMSFYSLMDWKRLKH